MRTIKKKTSPKAGLKIAGGASFDLMGPDIDSQEVTDWIKNRPATNYKLPTEKEAGRLMRQLRRNKGVIKPA